MRAIVLCRASCAETFVCERKTMMATMTPEKQAAVQALSSAGFGRSDYHFEKRTHFTFVKFRYGITNECVLEHVNESEVEQLELFGDEE